MRLQHPSPSLHQWSGEGGRHHRSAVSTLGMARTQRIAKDGTRLCLRVALSARPAVPAGAIALISSSQWIPSAPLPQVHHGKVPQNQHISVAGIRLTHLRYSEEHREFRLIGRHHTLETAFFRYYCCFFLLNGPSCFPSAYASLKMF